jgi:hypothetical protein
MHGCRGTRLRSLPAGRIAYHRPSDETPRRTLQRFAQAARGEPVILSMHPSYPNACAYVLKLHRDARPGLGRVMGRIENVTTGELFMFASAEELLACLARDSARNQSTD